MTTENKTTTPMEELSELTTVCPKCTGQGQLESYIGDEAEQVIFEDCPNNCTDGRVKLFDLMKDCPCIPCPDVKQSHPSNFCQTCWSDQYHSLLCENCHGIGKVLTKVHMENLLDIADSVLGFAQSNINITIDDHPEPFTASFGNGKSIFLGYGNTRFEAVADALLKTAKAKEEVE